MNKLPETKMDSNGDTLTQLKRTDNVALFKREKKDKSLVGYEVFFIKTVNEGYTYPSGAICTETHERYPAGRAFGVWAWKTTTEERANDMFNRMTDKNAVNPEIDPITNMPLAVADINPSDDIPDETSIPSNTVETVENQSVAASMNDNSPVAVIEPQAKVETVAVAAPVETPVAIETPVAAPIITPVETPVASVTNTASEVETVKRGRGRPRKYDLNQEWHIPQGEFTRIDFANLNGLPEMGAVWKVLEKLSSEGKIIIADRRSVGRGKPTIFYIAK